MPKLGTLNAGQAFAVAQLNPAKPGAHVVVEVVVVVVVVVVVGMQLRQVDAKAHVVTPAEHN